MRRLALTLVSSFLVLFLLFVWALEHNDEAQFTFAEIAFMVYTSLS
jgi:hypothetical protein